MSDNDNSFSRRQIVGSAGLGLAAIAGTVPASAQGSTVAVAPMPLEDPTKKYPRPPYNRQSQPWPGLASKMDPAPDHGEKSYRGSGRLTGRKALITGGDSGMGRAAAIAFAREGADVAINYLPSEEPDASEVVCPSSDSLGHFVSLRKGGSGSSVGDVMPPAGDAASGGWRWSCV
jgi:hypothetical protein